VLNAGNLSDSLCFERDRPLVESLVALFRREAEASGRPHTLLLVTKGGWGTASRSCAPVLPERDRLVLALATRVLSPVRARAARWRIASRPRGISAREDSGCAFASTP